MNKGKRERERLRDERAQERILKAVRLETKRLEIILLEEGFWLQKTS